MGVQGLTKYINNRKKIFFKDEVTLKDKPLIVDGSALLWQLMYDAPRREYGGDYDVQHDSLNSFFKKVEGMKIKMIVLIDGGNNVKLKSETIQSRYKEKIKKVRQFNNKRESYRGKKGELPLPLFSKTQFNEVLRENGIPFVLCEE